MNRDELLARFPNASPDFILRNARDAGGTAVQPDDTGPTPKLERNSRDGAMGAVQSQEGIGRRFLVRVKSYRKRLLDEDNLCEKYHVDLCRYSGALLGDEAGRTKIEVCQEKVGSKEPERVVIEIYRLR